MVEPLALTIDMISTALKAVSHEVFPHRALVNQLNWMKRRMRKPATMSVRQFVASVTQMNGKLIHFPGATSDHLFDPKNLLELLEFSLPDAWRAKFDLAGYIPTDHDKTRLVLEGEQIERAAETSKAAAIKPKQHSTAAGKTGSGKNRAHRGNNKNLPASVSSAAAKHKPPGKGDSVGKNFSGNKFRKELYALSKTTTVSRSLTSTRPFLKKNARKLLGEMRPLKRPKSPKNP